VDEGCERDGPDLNGEFGRANVKENMLKKGNKQTKWQIH
tara:strand:- start:404 stop:520 length:117 start_codon:yes stop_codon:yes gene_type:complete